MSEANLELARRFYPERVDLIAVVATPDAFRRFAEPIVDPEFELVAVTDQVPMSAAALTPDGSSRPTAIGIDGFLEAFRDWLSAWEAWVVRPLDFLAAGEDRVLVELDIDAKSKTHQVELTIPGDNVVTIRAGKIARIELYFDRGEARKAAGLK